jgi:alpha-galactosidase/6-phospho-beta-glucosidase family protein
MKIVLFGGGSHRYLGIARSIMAVPGLMEGGEINLYDLAVERSGTVGRMAMKSPEYQGLNCKITWGTSLDEALEGADIVYVVLMAGSRRNQDLLLSISPQHGFLASDQLSPSGAILALKGGPIVMDLAKRMEKICPNAWLVDFANPVAVLSAAVNNHTKTRCLGVCQGFTNHQWDLPRILFGKDEQWTDFDIRCAGVNHLSFILHGSTHRGRDLYELAAERLTEGWSTPELSDRWDDNAKKMITNSVSTLVGLYRKYGHLVFSSEGDGLAHLDIEENFKVGNKAAAPLSKEQLEERDRAFRARRAKADEEFRSWLDADLDAAGWDVERPEALYLLRADEDIMVKIAKGVSGIEELPIATSRPNEGAVAGFKSRTVLEYSQVLGGKGIRPAGEFEVPEIFQGLVSGLATHQTLLGDAIATRDPRILFEALYSYPVKQDSAESKALWRDLLAIAADEIPAEFQKTREMFIFSV